MLKARGYATAIYGKWRLGHLLAVSPHRHGFDDYFGLPYSNDMWPNTREDGLPAAPPLPRRRGSPGACRRREERQPPACARPPVVAYSVRVPPLRLLVVADDAVARAGLRALAEAAGLAVSGEAAVDELSPGTEDAVDAVLWDVGGTGGVEGLRLAATRAPVVAVLWSEDQAREALAAGARAVLMRERLDEQLAPAVSAAAAGLVVLEPSLSDALGAPPRTPGPEIVEALTPRESEVLQLVAAGLTNRRIGERLGISEHTVKFHVNAILGKLARADARRGDRAGGAPRPAAAVAPATPPFGRAPVPPVRAGRRPARTGDVRGERGP